MAPGEPDESGEPDARMIQMAEGPTDRPLVLFDGACNLCSATVRWIIERDRGRDASGRLGRLDFAALQSRAARAAIARAEGRPPGESEPPSTAPPGSIIFIGNGRILRRSDAALAIARELGGAWAIAAAIGAILPRFVRDALYDWIARNRYRWFGRRNACLVPTQELRARFLDADEPREVEPDSLLRSSPPERGDPAAPSSIIGSTFHRCVIGFLFVQLFPFPLMLMGNLVQIVASLGDRLHLPEPIARAGAEVVGAGYSAVAWVGSLKPEFVSWVSGFFIEKPLVRTMNGSGDTTFGWLTLAVEGALGAIIGIAWAIAALGQPISRRMRDLASILVRYYLAMMLLSYGWAKIVGSQMPAPGLDRLIQPIGDASPMGLLWTFMGASMPYQLIGGLAEAVGGFLLLWRRTTLLGAIVSAGVMFNVALLNYCYDTPVKILSTELLFMALYLIAPHAARLAAVLLFNLPAPPALLRPCPLPWRPARIAGRFVKMFFLYLVLVEMPLGVSAMERRFRLDSPMKAHAGLYRIESFSRGGEHGTDVPDAERWIRVGIGDQGALGIQFADGSVRRAFAELDPAAGIVKISMRGASAPFVLAFTAPDEDHLTLAGPFRGAPIDARLEQVEADFELTTRGFRWINEYPHNR